MQGYSIQFLTAVEQLTRISIWPNITVELIFINFLLPKAWDATTKAFSPLQQRLTLRHMLGQENSWGPSKSAGAKGIT